MRNKATSSLFGDMKQGTPGLHFENRYRCKDGSYRWLSWVGVPEGDVFVCSARDITDSKEQAGALRSSEDEALLREQFIAILSHDLRNPLAAIGSAIRIAGRQSHDETVGRMLTSIQDSAGRMAQLIDYTMDFARARLGGGIPVDLQWAENVSEGFEKVVDEIRLTFPERSIETVYAFDGAVWCDAARLDQLLSNLVANAVKHGSRDKPIKVATEAADGRFVLNVTNAGKRIPDDILSNLFEPFERGGESALLQGLGLGLYIADQIARAHAGRISATSDGRETVLRLEIPAKGSAEVSSSGMILS